MTRSNSARSGTAFFDTAMQVVSADANTYVVRAVMYLTSLNVTDSNNAMNVSGNWSRGGTLGLGGVYNSTPVWYQDIGISRVYGANQTLNVSMSFSGVEYWGVTLSASDSFTVPAKDPAVPTPVTAAVDGISATSAHVFTAAAYDDHGSSAIDVLYRIHRNSDGAHMGDLTGGYSGVTFTNLAAVTGYTAYANVRNGVGYAGWSAGVAFTTAAGVPAPPTVAVDTIGSTTAHVFTSVANADNGSGTIDVLYRIHRVSDGALIADLVGGYVGVTFTTLARATAYQAWAYKRNAIGISGWGGPTVFTTNPVVPTMGTSYSAGTITRNSAVITGLSVTDNGGQAPSNARVQYNTSATTVGATETTRGSWGDVTISGLTSLVTYYYRVAAFNSAGWSAYPAAWKSFVTLADAPNDMAAPTFSLVTDSTMRATWVAPAMNGATFVSYRYEVSLSNAFATLVTSGTTAALFVDLTGLIAGTRYYVRVRANATPNNGGYGIGNQLTTGIAPNSGLRVYAVIGGVVKQGKLYGMVGGSIRELKPMTMIGGVLQKE